MRAFHCKRRLKAAMPHQTFVEIDGEEIAVNVWFDFQPEEEDTNTQAGIEIECVESVGQDGGDVMHRMSEDQLDALGINIMEYIFAEPEY